ncbi:metallophosphoesterase [Labilibacter marinus]|uniref:metallophosphoesterase n=1 Tax=Labilibacter marinus TaxID=1477105 RepID=UPI001E498A08|nr:metallophosphoesterase [Labilibacter marinus]
MRFIIFFSIILGIHFLVNFYIYKRGLQGLEAMPQLIPYLRGVMLFLVLAYPVGRFLEKAWYSPVSSFIHWSGAFWFAGMLYFVLLIFTIDIIRWSNIALNFLPEKLGDSYLQVKLITTYVVTGIVVVTVVIGHINAWTPKIVKQTIKINKPGNERKSVKIVAASDIHLGTIIGPRKTGKLVKTINSLKPDIILFAGDVVDEDVKPVIKQNLGKNLLELKAPLGVYASTGNHEYIGGADNAVNYLESHDIKILRDESVLIDSCFYIIGREDREKTAFTNLPRKTVQELVENIDNSKPLILLDHQPYNLELAQQAGIDFQISGHTHHGQLWPFGYITSKLFEVSRGYKQKGNSHFYVSTGFGTWGPPVRLGNRPEILEFTLEFE